MIYPQLIIHRVMHILYKPTILYIYGTELNGFQVVLFKVKRDRLVLMVAEVMMVIMVLLVVLGLQVLVAYLV